MKEWFELHLFELITSFLGGTSMIGYFIERRRRKLAERRDTVDTLVVMQQAYDKFTEDYMKRYTALSEEVKAARDEILELTKKLQEESRRYYKLSSDHDKLVMEIEHLKELGKNK